MIQLAIKPGDLSLIPTTERVKRKEKLSQVFLQLTHMQYGTQSFSSH